MLSLDKKNFFLKILQFMILVWVLSVSLNANTKGFTPLSATVGESYKVYWDLGGDLNSGYDARVKVGSTTYQMLGGRKYWYKNFKTPTAGNVTFYFYIYKNGVYHSSYGSATITVKNVVVTDPTINSLNVSPSSIYVGDTINFYGYLSKSLPSGYEVKIEFIDADLTKTMSCSGSICSYSRSMSGLGINRKFRVKVYNSSGSLRNYKDGYYTVEEKSTTPPIYQSGTVSPTSAVSGSQFTFKSGWKDSDDPYVVNARVRYRKQGTTNWTERSLDYLNTINSVIYAQEKYTISGSAGTYEYQFRASASKTASATGVASNWSSSRTFTITELVTNHPPTHQTTYPQPAPTINKPFYIYSKWTDTENDYIVAVKIRYRKQGTTPWNTIYLDYDKDTTFKKQLTLDIGIYDVQVQASDVEKLGDKALHTTDWLSVNSLTVQDKSTNIELTSFDKEQILASNSSQYLELYGSGLSVNSTVEWKYGEDSDFIPSERTWASDSKVRIKFITTSSAKGTWQFRVKEGSKYSNWKSIEAIYTGSTGNHLQTYVNAIGGTCPPGGKLIPDKWNFYKCECTSYVAWKMNQQGVTGFTNYYKGGHFSNANNWENNARKIGWSVSQTPTVGSIAQTDNGTWGHVAYVEAVNGDNITVSEYNLKYDHTYTTRTVSKSKFDNYITPSTESSIEKPELYNFDKNEIIAKNEPQSLIINGSNFTSNSLVEWKFGSDSEFLRTPPQFISNNQLKITFTTLATSIGEWSFRVKNGDKQSDWESIMAKEPVSLTKPEVFNISNEQTDTTVNLSVYAKDDDNDLGRVEIHWEGYNKGKSIITDNLNSEIKRSHTYTQTTEREAKTIYIFAYDTAGNRSVQRTQTVYISSIYKDTKINNETVANSACLGVQKERSIGTAVGAEMMSLSLLKVKGLHTVSFDLSYNSLLLTDNTISQGWNHNFGFTSYIETQSNGNMKVYWDDGHYNIFIREGGSKLFYSNDKSTKYDLLKQNDDNSFTLTRENRITYHYSEYGKIQHIQNYKNQGLNFSFDDQGRIQRVTDVVSDVYLDYAYNDSGKLAIVSDELGREVTLIYNAKDQLSQIIAPEEIIYFFEYTADLEQLYKVTYGDNTPYYHHTYNNQGQVISEDDGKGDNQLARFSYLEDDRFIITTHTNKEGEKTQYKYGTEDFRLLSVTSPDNNITTNEYYDDGRLKSTTNAKGYTTTFAYDNVGNLIKKTYDDTSYETMSYDSNRNLLAHTLVSKEGISYTTTNSYDSNNNLLQKALPNGDITQYTYNSNNQVETITSPSGYVTNYTYENGRLKRIKNSNNHTEIFNYDIVGRLTSKVDKQGNTTYYHYDNADRLIKVINPAGGETSYTYDSRGNKIAESDPMDNITTYEYDNNNNLILMTNALGYETSYKYDGEDRLIATTNARGYTSSVVYDALGRVIQNIDAMGNTHTIEYDALGNVKQEFDAYGNLINSYDYDAKNRLVKSVDILNNQTATSYNVLNQPATVTDPLDRVSTFNYDKVGRVVEAIDALGGKSTQTFDNEGNRVSFSDPNQNQTSYQYDKLGNTLKETTASGSSNSYLYNANNQVIQSTNGRGQVKNIAYNENGAVTQIKDSVGTIDYTYDKNGNILTLTENGKTISYGYDVLNRVISYTDTEGNKIGYAYDSLNNLTALTYPDGKVVKYTYNVNGQLILVTDWNNNKISYEYDKNGKLVKTTLANGTYTTRTYDNAGRLLKQQSYPHVSLYSFKYDKVGNIIEEESSSEISPKELADIEMSYVKGNLIDKANQTESSFDGDDNMLTLGSLSFTYDSRNRLTKAKNTSYVYNALNHRVSQTTDGKKTSYITNPNASLSQLLVKTDSDGSKTYYVYGLGLISQTKGSQTHYYHYDLRGSTIALSDKNGQITDKFSYLPYGELYKHEIGSTNTPFLYNGRDGVMRETNNLYYMRARYYSTDIKRFVNRDTLIGSVGDFGSLNRFGYVEGNSVNFIDPSGNVLDTIWDVGNVIHDVGRLGKNGLEMIYEGGRYAYGSGEGYFTGDYSRQHDASKEFINDAKEFGDAGVDLVLDGGATLVPYVPAGTRKFAKQAYKRTKNGWSTQGLDFNHIPNNKYGTYEFIDINGKRYIGKAEKQTIQARIKQHVRDGKLHPDNIQGVQYKEFPKPAIPNVEKTRIRVFDTVDGNLGNKQHAPRSRSCE